MRYIVGLGNPGRNYEKTRHNVGFMVIDELCRRWGLSLNKEKFKGIYGMGSINGEKVILLKPLTYMNLSGESIRPLLDYYEIDVEDLIVIYDDLDLPTGKIHLRTKGSAGGHNGIKSTIQHLGTQNFNRLRIGIDRPINGMKVPDYVLGVFSAEEQPEIEGAIKQAADACEKWLSHTFLEVMNEFNQK
ncbi:aminoacyl-tRNA hydrolase [Schinkia azotoformans]|uniref:aminoacyl-tRNA hydrolase n=1 Tax=Schinkia azotoformans TaxID=1454 RepID=UPI002DC064C6|nr:aminoacyl-tRNA hydrolase [Schinkia azotoformans]MEC1767381.1 aminoacyl-tRNA hydrolase [Schinkia azotoformans]